MLVEITAIELVPRRALLESVISAQIHHHGIRVKLGGQCPGSAMRQCENDYIMPIKHFGGGVLHHQISQLRNMGHVLAELVPHRGMSGNACHLEIRMGGEYTERLTPRIPGRTGHGYRIFGHVTSLFLDSLKHPQHTLYAVHCIIMHPKCVG